MATMSPEAVTIADDGTARCRVLNDKRIPDHKSCVLYIIARDQRLHDNHALAYAQQQALTLRVPLAVVFCLQPRRGQRAREHYEFMITGLRELEAALAVKNIPLLMVIGPAAERLGGVAHHLNPQLMVFDYSPLLSPRRLQAQIAQQANCRVVTVDTHNVIPVWQASNKQEIGARTLRPKIHKKLTAYLDEAHHVTRHPYNWPGPVQPIATLQLHIDELLSGIPQNHTASTRFVSGEKAAQQALDDFIAHRLQGYATNRNVPPLDGQSDLSPYLHFGQLSAAEVVRAVQQYPGEDADALIEELVVRKELSDNFCHYNHRYRQLTGAPEWAQKTLEKHAEDPREFTYNRQQFEAAQTHDPAWNAAQIQLRRTGKMHGYMRMYWAKKVLEWSESPQTALATLLYFNDFYHLDGGDPNGYVGILWSIAGLHDRPWHERPVYGTVRSMVYTGLKRKFDISAYINQFQVLEK